MYAADLLHAKSSTMLECNAAVRAMKLADIRMQVYCTRGPMSLREMQCCWHGTDSTDRQRQLNALSTCASKAYAVRCMHHSASRAAMCIDTCVDMCIDMCIDVYTGMCIHGC